MNDSAPDGPRPDVPAGGTARSWGPHWYGHPAPEAAAAAVARAFAREYGRRPDGVWASPGRVNLIGEHVDYNAGIALPYALPHRTFVAAGLRDDDVLRAHSPHLTGQGGDPRWQGRLSEVGPGRVNGWGSYVAGVPWALHRAGYPARGVDLEIESFVPMGAGLSSSAAVECAVALALDDLLDLGLGADDDGRARLAAACVEAENLIAGAPTGGLDQAASLRCRADHALALDCRDFRTQDVPLAPRAAHLELLVIDSRARHANVDGQYASRRESCTDAARLLGVGSLRDIGPTDLDSALDLLARSPHPEAGRRVRHVVTEIARVEVARALLTAGRLAEIGSLLDASHASLSVDYEVSCPELDTACAAARGAGALGARMTGGGFGGSAIALVPATAVHDVATAVTAAFARAGFALPAFLRAEPSAGGGRCG